MDTKNLELAMQQAGDLIREQMVDTLFENKSVITGDLARSITPITSMTDKGIKLNIELLLYGLYVDQGDNRHAGKQPPISAISNWIKQKRIPVPMGLSLEQFSFIIARKIGKKGQFKKPKPFIEPSINKVVNDFLPTALEEAGVKDIEEAISIIAKNFDK